MSYALSRLMSAATASYAGYCFYDPGHLGRAMGADGKEQAGYDLLAEVFGVRDLAISSFGVLGRSDRTVRTAMWIRIACDELHDDPNDLDARHALLALIDPTPPAANRSGVTSRL